MSAGRGADDVADGKVHLDRRPHRGRRRLEAILEQDTMGHQQHAVTHHWISQDSEDQRHPAEPGVPSAEEAKAFREALESVWDVSDTGQA
jgi:hypothetical protein